MNLRKLKKEVEFIQDEFKSMSEYEAAKIVLELEKIHVFKQAHEMYKFSELENPPALVKLIHTIEDLSERISTSIENKN